MKYMALKLVPTPGVYVSRRLRVPKGTVVVGLKKFDGTHEVLVGPYSYKIYRTPLGKWARRYNSLIMCGRGWHFSDVRNIKHWSGDTVYIVEARGTIMCSRGRKAVASQIRVMERVTGDRLTSVDRYIRRKRRAQ